MEKKLIDGVYTVIGIDSTSQVREFYQEVVDGNYEKYVAISIQNIKFKFNHNTDKAEVLQPNETYALNPMYRKIDVTPIEELVKEQTEKELDTPVTEEITIKPEEVQPAQDEQREYEQTPVIVDETPGTLQASQTKETSRDVGLDEAYEELNNNYIQLKALYDEQNKNIKFEKERADVAEQDLALAKEGYKKIKEQLDEKSKQLEEALIRNDDLLRQLEKPQEQESEPITIESIINMAEEIGYEVFFRKLI